jgi:hypothetical protein
MAGGQGLADLLSGAAGAPVNRPQLNAFVANSQATNGLRSAQTEEALLNAQRAQEEQQAGSDLEEGIRQAYPNLPPSQVHLIALTTKMHTGSFVNAIDLFKAQNAMTLSDPNQLNTPAQTAAAQGMSGKLEGPQPLPPQYSLPAGVMSPQTGQSSQGVANVAATTALAGLNAHKDADPAAFRAQTFGATSPDGQAALTKAVQEGRLDPTRINSRTAPILAQMELQTPGMNFNRLHADAALQSNATFQQKAMSVDMLPGLLSNVTSLGKKLNGGTGYNDLKTVGMMQQFMNGQTNDPDYTEYMTARNDTLLRLASVMRGTGMSDQAHTAEVEAMAPTLAPYALDAWLKGQMSVVTPLLARQNRITHLGEPGGGTAPLAAPQGAAPAGGAAPMSLDDYLKSQGH